jgi:hypothetical protein
MFDLFGRGERIRTSDPLHPMQVRYQAALRPDEGEIITEVYVMSPRKAYSFASICILQKKQTALPSFIKGHRSLQS